MTTLVVLAVAGKDLRTINKSFSGPSLSNLLLWDAYIYYASLGNTGTLPLTVTQFACNLFQQFVFFLMNL